MNCSLAGEFDSMRTELQIVKKKEVVAILYNWIWKLWKRLPNVAAETDYTLYMGHFQLSENGKEMTGDTYNFRHCDRVQLQGFLCLEVASDVDKL